MYTRNYLLNTKEGSNSVIEDQQQENLHKIWKTNSNLADINPPALAITLNENGLISPSKSQRLIELIN